MKYLFALVVFLVAVPVLAIAFLVDAAMGGKENPWQI